MSSENISSNQESPNHNDGDDNENVSYLSPYGGTPPRTMSSHSLIGEDITQMDAEISPFTPSESTTPPRSHQMLPPSLSPPPLSVNSDVQFHDDQHYHYLQQQHSVQSAASSYNKQPTVPGNNSNTRPPRIPQISLPSRGTDPPRGHGRVHSTASADYSFLSALTDSSSETTVPKRRTVSFDMNDSTFNNRRAGDAAISSPGAMTTPASILQPILLEDTKHDVTPPASIVTANVKKFEETEPQNTASLGQSVATSTKVTTSESNNSLTGQPINNKMDWGVPVVDTGSFVRTSSEFEKYSELNTPTSTQMLQQHYSLTDVIDATPGDAQDEVDFLSSLESQGLRRNSKENPSLFPFVTDNRIHDFEEQNDEQTDPEKTPDVYIEHHRKETRNDLSFLMKQLADASPPQLDKTTSVPATGFVEIATKLFSSRSTSSHTKQVSKGDLESGEETQRPDPENDGDHGPARSRPYFRIFRRLKEDADYFLDFMEPQTVSIRKSFYSGLKYFMIPCLGIALLLYYGLGNPPESAGDEKPSSSWWLLFLGVRQVITLYMARISEIGECIPLDQA